MQHTVIAIDVGFGDVKFLAPRETPLTPEAEKRALLRHFEPRAFPALPVAASPGDDDLMTGTKHRANVTRVTTPSGAFWVGPEVHTFIKPGEESRTISDAYCLTDEYRACVYGVLARARVSSVDLLVLGLPVTTWAAYKERLIELYEQVHQVTEDFSVTVTKVLVSPQPLGGFYDFMNSVGFSTIKESQTLIIDPGHNTLDWLLTDGNRPLPKQSGSRKDSGMRKLIEVARANLARQFSEIFRSPIPIEDMHPNLVAQYLRDGMTSYRFCGKVYQNEIDHAACRADIDGEIRTALRALVTSVGNAAAIDRVIVVGGGAELYYPEVRAAFPRHAHTESVHVTKSPAYANVRGFKLIGDRWAQTNADLLAERARQFVSA